MQHVKMLLCHFLKNFNKMSQKVRCLTRKCPVTSNDSILTEVGQRTKKGGLLQREKMSAGDSSSVKVRESKEYFPRVYPLERYRESVFHSRFRFNKDVVRQLSDMYDSAGFCPVFTDQGGAVRAEDRVSTPPLPP